MHVCVLQRKTREREGYRSSEGTGESSQREREDGDGEEEDGKDFVVCCPNDFTVILVTKYATRCVDGWFFCFYHVERHWIHPQCVGHLCYITIP